MCSYCLPNPRSFCKMHCSLTCAVLPCALVKYLVNRTAYDESTAWFRVQHCLKPLRPLAKKNKKNSILACVCFFWLFFGHRLKCFRFRSEYLKIQANEQCCSEFYYKCKTNDRNVSVTILSQQKKTKIFQ